MYNYKLILGGFMTTFEIRRHEELKAMSVYAYHPENKEPNGYKLMMVSTLHNGFYACVLKREVIL